jgi:hypothetical protein
VRLGCFIGCYVSEPLPFVSPCLFFNLPGPKVGVCVLEVALAGLLFVELLQPFVQIRIEQIVAQWLVHDARRQKRRLQGCGAGQTSELMDEAENAKEAEKEDGDWTKGGEERSNLMRGSGILINIYEKAHLRERLGTAG